MSKVDPGLRRAVRCQLGAELVREGLFHLPLRLVQLELGVGQLLAPNLPLKRLAQPLVRQPHTVDFKS
jgi:hypothetical protein